MPRPLIRILLAAAFAAALGAICPAVQAQPQQSWSVRVWRTSDGLPDEKVASVCQTKDGFLWIASGQTFSRFDGSTFEPVRPEEFAGAQASHIQLALALRDGSLAMITDRGTVISTTSLGAKTWNPHLAPGTPDAALEDGEGALWVLYHGGKLYRIRPGKAESFSNADGLPDGMVDGIVCDIQGRLWFWRGGVIGLFRDGRFVTLLRVPGPHVRVARCQAGGVWITIEFGLYRTTERGQLEKVATMEGMGPGMVPTAIQEDRSGGLWIGTSAEGLIRFDGQTFENIPISHREVLSLFEDREGSLWVGTKSGGLNQVQAKTIAVEGGEVGLPSRAVQRVCQAPDGRMLGLSQDGIIVSRTDDGWKPAFGSEANIPLEGTCIAPDPSGAIWIGTKFYRLYLWKDGQVKSWGRDEGIISHTIRTLLIDRHSDLWIGGEGPGAVMRIHDGKLTHLPLPAPMGFFRAMTEDSAGAIWVGGGHGAFLRIEGDKVTDESRYTAGLDKQICALAATSDGSIWIGLLHGGIARLKGQTFTRVTTAEGLLDDEIATLMPDGFGWIWCASSRGIFKLREEDVDAIGAGKAARLECYRYGREEGLQMPHLAFGDAPSAFKSRDGRIWFPMATALAIADPRVSHAGPADSDERAADPPLITNIMADGKPIYRYGGVLPLGKDTVPADRIPAGTREVGIDFTSLSLSAPDNVHFRYRLDPYDERWIEAGPGRHATYSGLGPGRYRFAVMASDSDGVWSPAAAIASIAVLPYFWQTWWFRCAVVILFTGFVFALARYIALRRLQPKLRALERQAALDKERARIARDIHDDLGGRLTKIVLLSGLATRDRAGPEKAGERVREIAETARQMIASLDETVWAVNPRNDTLPHLIDYIGQSAVKFMRTADIPCQVDLPDDTPNIRISSDVRHNLFLTVQEALTNVVRHAQATGTWLRVSIASEALWIAIEDNGRGISEGEGGPGADGLRNMRERMAQIGGLFQIESGPGSGTRIRLVVPQAAWS